MASSAVSNSVSSAAYAGAELPAREPLGLRRAEEQRRRREDVEDEHQHAEQQHEELQRDLPVRAHQQRMPRFVDRARRQVALHLALIGAEVRAEEEERGDRARPERVLVGEVEREVERPQPAGRRGDAQPVADADAGRQAEDRGRRSPRTGRRR